MTSASIIVSARIAVPPVAAPRVSELLSALAEPDEAAEKIYPDIISVDPIEIEPEILPAPSRPPPAWPPPGPPPPVGLLTFNFDSGTLPPGWRTNESTLAWQFWNGSTPTENTGPSDDVGIGGGYWYAEVSQHEKGSRFELMYDGTGCSFEHQYALISFYYHMFGAQMGTLALEAADGSNLWSKSSNQGDAWRYAPSPRSALPTEMREMMRSRVVDAAPNHLERFHASYATPCAAMLLSQARSLSRSSRALEAAISVTSHSMMFQFNASAHHNLRHYLHWTPLMSASNSSLKMSRFLTGIEDHEKLC